jgi:hypothetical protein
MLARLLVLLAAAATIFVSSMTHAQADPQAPAAIDSAAAAPAAVKTPILVEPEKLNVVCAVDSNGALVALDLETSKVISGAKWTGGAKTTAQLPGPHARVRLIQSEDISFVVRLASGVDPGTCALYKFESKKDKRELVPTESSYLGDSKSNQGLVRCDITKYGESYRLTPTKPLPTGEYGFPTSSWEFFSFGVDAPK